MPADIARRLVSNQGMHVMRMLLTTIALSLCVGLLVHAQTGVDFSGNWILESQATADTATALSVRQSLVSTNVRGEPMKPHFRDIAIDREVGGTTRSEGHGISRTVHGTPESVRRVLHREGPAYALGGNPLRSGHARRPTCRGRRGGSPRIERGTRRQGRYSLWRRGRGRSATDEWNNSPIANWNSCSKRSPMPRTGMMSRR
jgi:hypothetical protein